MKKIMFGFGLSCTLLLSACSYTEEREESVVEEEVVEEELLLGPEQGMDEEYVYFDTNAPVNPVELFAIVEDGVLTPSEFRVKKGDYVLLSIMNRGEEHAIVIPQYGWRTILHEDEETEFGFRARERGAFPFHCSEYCTQREDHLRGMIYVE